MGKPAGSTDDPVIQQKITQLSALIERMRELERNNQDLLNTNAETRKDFERLMAVLQASRASLEQLDKR